MKAISILLLLATLASSQEIDHAWNDLDGGLPREEIGRKSANVSFQSSDSLEKIGLCQEESPPRSSS
jgi:hypothetical protein